MGLRLRNSSGNYVELNAPSSIATDVNLTLPNTDGDSGQYLQTNGSGALSWATVSTSNLTRGTAASLTGTSVTFTSLPAGIRRLIISISGGSVNGDSDLGIRIGDSGGIETTGYTSDTSYHQNASYGARGSDTMFRTIFNNSGVLYSGHFELINHSGNIWTFRGLLGDSGLGTTIVSAGGKELSAELTQIELFPQNSPYAFDAGTVNIMYEV